MNVLVVEPGFAPYEKEINGLDEMQATVGGLIQAIYPYEEQVAIVCNEEGLLLNLDYNRSVPGGYGGVVGTFFICGLGEEDFCTLPPELMDRFKKEYYKAEVLLGFRGDGPITLKVPPKQKSFSDTPAKQQAEPTSPSKKPKQPER